MSIRLGNNIVAGRSAYQPSLFDFKWADHALNDPSWVRADTYNWLYEAAYDVAYDHLVSDITGKTLQSETIAGITITFYLAADGHKICMFNQNDILQALYDSTGIAWYYILDINNHRFKLPRTKFGFQGIKDSVGKYIAPGIPAIPDHTHTEYWPFANNYLRTISPTVGATGDGSTKSLQNTTPYHNYDADGSVSTSGASTRTGGVYGASSTVQPPATQMYLYFYLGSFSEQALENAADLSINELEEFLDDRVATKQDIATAVNYDNISNCITEIPQDIKLELNASVLTLKAGSKVYVPNGVGVFNEITISSDISIDYSGWGTQKRLLTYNTNNNSLEAYELDTQTASGGSAPTVTYVYMTWYDTTNNLVKYTDNSGSTWVSGGSLPLAIFSGDDSVLYQVFNGFGYIGECTFTLPGVKFLCPNGSNVDGSLASIERTISSVKVVNLTGQTSMLGFLCSDGIVGYGVNGYFEQDITPPNFESTPHATWYNTADNYVYVTADGGSTWTKSTDRLYLGVMKKSSSGNIENLHNKKVFRAPEKINNTQTGLITVTLDGNYSGVVKYFVKDGWCTVRFWHIVSTAVAQSTHPLGLTQQLPLPLGYSSGGANYAIPLCMANNGGQVGMWVYWENNDPNLKCHCYTANVNCYGTFTYPIEQ